jgi:transcriptional regulator with XRE-family HTH domain
MQAKSKKQEPRLVVRCVEKVTRRPENKAELEDVLQLFADNLRRTMVAQRLSAKVLAAESGIAPKTLNNLLRARHSPTFDIMIKLANALQIDFRQLMDRRAPRHGNEPDSGVAPDELGGPDEGERRGGKDGTPVTPRR